MDKLLTVDDVRHAIVVDFEGRTDRTPILLGVRRPTEVGEGAIEQSVLAPAYRPAATAKGLPMATVEDAVAAVVDRAEATDAWIVGWSGHEIDVVTHSCSAELAERFVARYADAKVMAKAARRRQRVALPPARGRERRHSLGRYQRLIGFDVPFPFGTGWTGDTIRILDDAWRRHGDWESLRPRQKMRWSNLLGHNRSDLDGTAAVAAWAASVLDAADRPAA